MFLASCSSSESEEKEKCGLKVYEFIAYNPGVGVCQTYSNFPPDSTAYSEQLNFCILYSLLYYNCGQKKSKPIEINLNPFLSQKRQKDNEEEEISNGRILGWFLIDQYIKKYGQK